MFYYDTPPHLPHERRRPVIEALATWLASGRERNNLAAWGEAEWQFAEWAAYWQGASAWLVLRLGEDRLQPPPEVAARLEAAAADIRLRTLLMLADAARLLGALERQGIPAVPLKGAVLAPGYYPDPEIRALGDLDILVRRSDLPGVRQVMAGLGYRFLKRSEKDETYLLGEYKQNSWAPDNVHPVEIQHRVLSEYAGALFDLTAAVWQHSPLQPYLGGPACRQPDPAVLLAHVCSHALADWVLGQGKLIQINDLLVLVGGMAESGWKEFSDLAAGDECFIFPALLLLERLAPGSLPEAVSPDLAATLPPLLQAWCREVPLAALFELYTDDPIRRDFNRQVSELFRRGPRDAWSASFSLVFPPRWHSRLEAYPRLVGSPFWPLAYLPLNGSRLLRAGKKRLGR